MPSNSAILRHKEGASGHTFGDADFRGTNAWLYPRLGDYAVVTANGDVAISGFFDEQWRLK